MMLIDSIILHSPTRLSLDDQVALITSWTHLILLTQQDMSVVVPMSALPLQSFISINMKDIVSINCFPNAHFTHFPTT